MSNSEEYIAGMNPRNPDEDSDGLVDGWEMEHFLNLGQNAGGDFDEDNLTNLEEYNNRTDPNNDDTNKPMVMVISPANNSQGIWIP